MRDFARLIVRLDRLRRTSEVRIGHALRPQLSAAWQEIAHMITGPLARISAQALAKQQRSILPRDRLRRFAARVLPALPTGADHYGSYMRPDVTTGTRDAWVEL
jgi:hypothetical protein